MNQCDIKILKSVIKEEFDKMIFEMELEDDILESDDEFEIDPLEASEAAPRRKRVVRKGKPRYKMVCPDKWSWDAKRNICVLPTRATQIKRARAAKRGNRKKRAFKARISKNRVKSLRKVKPSL